MKRIFHFFRCAAVAALALCLMVGAGSPCYAAEAPADGKAAVYSAEPLALDAFTGETVSLYS